MRTYSTTFFSETGWLSGLPNRGGRHLLLQIDDEALVPPTASKESYE